MVEVVEQNEPHTVPLSLKARSLRDPYPFLGLLGIVSFALAFVMDSFLNEVGQSALAIWIIMFPILALLVTSSLPLGAISVVVGAVGLFRRDRKEKWLGALSILTGLISVALPLYLYILLGNKL